MSLYSRPFRPVRAVASDLTVSVWIHLVLAAGLVALIAGLLWRGR